MGIDSSAIARVVGVTTEFEDLRDASVLFLPQRIAVFAQGATAVTFATTKKQVTSAKQVGDTYGYGSPAHLIARELFPVNGDGVGTIPVTIYPLEDDGGGAASAGDITPSGAATSAEEYRVRVNGILSSGFTIPVGAVVVATVVAQIVAAVNAVLEMPTIATDGATVANFVSKWFGATANDIFMEIIGPSAGVTFAITQHVGGTVNPSLTAALAQVGNIWETIGINQMEFDDAVTLDELSAFGEGRWGAIVRKPMVFCYGNTEIDQPTAVSVTSTRGTDRTNVQLVAPGSVNLEFVVAAREVARVARVANSNPPTDYGSQRATGLIPGLDGDQWDYPTRDAAVKGGSSTVEVVDSVVNMADTITMYAPVGETPPAYRYVVDIVKLQQIHFNVALIFATPEWDGAPLIPDDQPTVNPNAKTPKQAKAEIAGLIDALALQAIISDPAKAKKSITAVINSQNPKRLDIVFTVQLSGNSNIIDVTLKFGFFFGAQAAAA